MQFPRVIHADAHIAVIDKPSGLLSVPGKGPEKQNCAISRVRALFPHATGPMIVHRLDMDTSGILAIALDPQTQRDMSLLFEQRKVTKAYTALVAGDVHGDTGEVELPIRLDIDNRPYQIVDFVHGRPSTTRWRVMARETDRTRVRFEPVTGRAHQLRVHASQPRVLPDGRVGGLGCPILGDVLYGDGASAERLMLHACELGFTHPRTGIPLEFRCEAPF